MTLAERIREAMEAAGLSPAELARATKRTNGAVTQWLDGTTKSLKAETAGMIEAATGYRAAWLVTGRGQRKVESTSFGGDDWDSDETRKAGLIPILSWEHEDDLPPGEFVMIPRFRVMLSAGNGHSQADVEFLKDQPQAFRADWIRTKHLKPSKLVCMTADGSSMEPRIWDGDSLVVDTSQTRVVDGKVFAIHYDGGERVKRLHRLPGGGLRISSDNPGFETIELSADETEHVRVLGRIVQISGDGGL